MLGLLAPSLNVGRFEPEAHPAPTVLIVDDDPLIRDVITAIARDEGCAAIVTASGDEAMRIVRYRAEPIDLVICDVSLEDVTGFEVARAVQADRPQAKLVLVSGYPREDYAEEVIGEGVPFLVKPFRPAEMREVIRTCLSGPATRDQ